MRGTDLAIRPRVPAHRCGESGRSDAGRRSHGSLVEMSSILVSSTLETCDRRSHDHPRAPCEAAAPDRPVDTFARARPPTSSAASSARSPSIFATTPTSRSEGTGCRTRAPTVLEDASDAFAHRIRESGGGARGPAQRAIVRGGAARLQARDRVPLESPRQLGARVGNRDGAVGELRALPRRARPPRLVRSVPADQVDQRVLRRQPRPRAAGADLGHDHRPAVVSHRSRQRLDRVEPHRTGGGAAGLLHRPEDHGRLARSLPGRHGVRATASSSRRRQPLRSIWIWIRPRLRTPPQAAGIDAAEAVVQLPRALRSDVPTAGQHASRAGTPRARCSAARWTSSSPGQTPIWLPLIGQILVPYAADHAHERAGPLRDRRRRSRRSARSRAARRSIPRLTGWLLPAAKIDPLTRRRRGRHRLALRDDAEGALDDVAGSHARQDHAAASRA